MATQFIGINRGEQLKDAAAGTSSTGKDIELAVKDSVGLTRNEIRDQVEVLLQHVANHRSTPFK